MAYIMKFKQERRKDRLRSELKLSWLQVFIGATFLISAVLLLSWNELAAIDTNKSLAQALQDLRTINNIWKIEQINDGALVYVSGILQVGEPLTEPDYGISVPAVLLKRRVQMYQWVEEVISPSLSGMKKDSGSSARYTYYTSWKDKLVDSSKFHDEHGHHNPTKFPVKSHQYMSDMVKVGAFVLSAELKWKFTEFTLVTSDERPERRDIKMHAGLYYHTADVWDPHVGDLRIQFSYAGMPGDVVSVIARQRGNLLGGEDVIFLEKGKVCPEDMIKNEHNKNIWMIRFYRSVSWLLLYLATSCFTFLLDVLALFAVIVSSIWLSYKPWISASILLGFSTPGIISSVYRQFRTPDNNYHHF
ncbi:transmembrane protein 43 isoform X2 [Rhodnius prolixus]|uniref:transmembrane protein 43 isoform X2 n=1 Tax=Rhodnius prolixus TaxID=13249 RepID=UPI003D18DBB9